MSPHRSLILFLVKVIVICTLLTAAWPLVDGMGQAMFRTIGAVAVPSYNGSSIRLRPLDEPDKYVDTLVHMKNLRNGAASRMRLSARYIGWAPAALFLALVLATPIPWRRRGWAVAWGLPIIAIMIGLRVLLHVRGDLVKIGVIEVQGLDKYFMKLALNAVSVSTFTWYVMPVLVWILVAFRRGDLAALTGSHAGDSEASHKSGSSPGPST